MRLFWQPLRVYWVGEGVHVESLQFQNEIYFCFLSCIPLFYSIFGNKVFIFLNISMMIQIVLVSERNNNICVSFLLLSSLSL